MQYHFTAGELAALAGLSKQTILFYDKKGILNPDYVNPKNGYRYYTADQLDLLDNISMLKEIGLSLEEIRSFMENRTKDYTLTLMEEQLLSIHMKIRHLKTIEKQLAWKAQTLRNFSAAEKEVSLIRHEKPEILAAEAVDFSKRGEGTDEEDLMAQNIAVKKLMTKAKREQFPYFYQQGAFIPLKELEKGRCLRASHVFLPLMKRCSKAFCLIKPPGLYAHYYFEGRYTESGKAYHTLFSELSEKGMTPVSGSYEYCILDSLTTSDCKRYVTAIEIQVERTKSFQEQYSYNNIQKM